ncbi:MAG: sugar-transfer associated ATP-grasp domain-containing protein [Candidatus Paceibacterota bacterium]
MLSIHENARRLEHRYRRYRSGRAIRKTLQMLLKNSDVAALGAKTIREIKEYTLHTFHDATYAPWLIFYATFQGTFKEGWIPDDFFLEKVLPHINRGYQQFGRAKSLGNRILGTDALPNRATFINGKWYDMEGAPLEADQLDHALFSTSDTVYIKPENSNKGRGIIVTSRGEFHALRLPSDQVFAVQRSIRHHRWFDRFYRDAVATLRVITATCNAQAPTFQAAYLRLGYGTAQVVSAESVRVAVVDQEGTLGPFASGPAWERYRKHPDSNQHFDGLRIPYFQQAVAVCENLHRRVPQLGFIGWDVAIDDSGKIAILEFNTNHPAINLPEATVGPCFRNLDFERFAQADRRG